MTIFDVQAGYWYGMAAVGAATVLYNVVCWLLPPKKRAHTEK